MFFVVRFVKQNLTTGVEAQNIGSPNELINDNGLSDLRQHRMPLATAYYGGCHIHQTCHWNGNPKAILVWNNSVSAPRAL